MGATSVAHVQIEDVVAHTLARPWADQAWVTPVLAGLHERLADVCATWGLTIEGVHEGGVGVPVMAVRTASGVAAALKLGHGEGFAQQCRVLVAAGGVGYVRVLEHDTSETHQSALLMERLGESLAHTTPDPAEQTRVLADLAATGWRLPVTLAPEAPAGDKARSLREFLARTPLRGGPHEPVLARADDLAAELERHPDPDVVLVHGDPHSLNALARPGAGHVLIDPDGFRGERAYDLGVVLRDLAGDIDRLDDTEGRGAGARWHEQLARDTAARHGVDPDRTLAWAFVERCTTGAYLHLLGYTDEGQQWLTTAARLL